MMSRPVCMVLFKRPGMDDSLLSHTEWVIPSCSALNLSLYLLNVFYIPAGLKTVGPSNLRIHIPLVTM